MRELGPGVALIKIGVPFMDGVPATRTLTRLGARAC